MHEGAMGCVLRLQFSRDTSLEASLGGLQLAFHMNEGDFINCTKQSVWMGLPEPCRPNLHPSVYDIRTSSQKTLTFNAVPVGLWIHRMCCSLLHSCYPFGM
jgi:hypothetical protein